MRTQAGSWAVGKKPSFPFWILCTCLFMTDHAEPLLEQILGLLVQHFYSGSWVLTAEPIGGDSTRLCQPVGLTNLVVAMNQDNTKVGGLEPAPALHDNVVALADVIDVHRDAGICPCNAQEDPGVPRPAQHSP